jgi:Arc/MetJ family transcription regulator
MRTNIVIDDKLMMDALKASGLKTKREVVEKGLELLVRRSQQQEIRKLRGRIKWEGDLDEMREPQRCIKRIRRSEARRVVFPGAARSVDNRSVASPYVRIGNASTDPGNAAIPGSVAILARNFMQRWG